MFSPFGFSIQEFFICYFYCSKTAFVCEFQHTPLWKINKNMERHIPYLLIKMVFLAFKTVLSPLDARKKNFFVNFEHYDLANSEE
jgi:hypothetical protein